MSLTSLFTKTKRPNAAEIDPPTNPGRHRSADLEPTETVPDNELESYLAALAPERDPESTDTGSRFGDAQTYRLRLTPIAGEQLRELAEAHGLSPQALAQEWVLQRLAWESENGRPAGVR